MGQWSLNKIIKQTLQKYTSTSSYHSLQHLQQPYEKIRLHVWDDSRLTPYHPFSWYYNITVLLRTSHMLLLCPNSFYRAFFIRKKISVEHKCKAVIIVHFFKWKLCESYLIQVGLLFRFVKFKIHTDANYW